MKQTNKTLMKYLKPHSGLFLLVLFCMLLNALTTGFYAYLIGPVVKFLFVGGLGADDSLTKLLSFVGLTPVIDNSEYLLKVLPLLILIAAILKGVTQYGKFYLMGLFGEQTVFMLRADLLDKLHRLSDKLLDKSQVGDVITRISSDVTLLQEALTTAISSLVSDSLKIIILLSLAIWLDWRLALVTFVVLPFVVLPIVWIGKRLKNTSIACQKEKADMISHVEEDFRSARLIKAYNLQDIRATKFAAINKNYLAASLKSFKVRAFASPLMEIIGAFGLALTLYVASFAMHRGDLVAENFVSFFAAILMMYEPMKNLGRLNNVIQSGKAGFERAFAMYDWESEKDLGKLDITAFKDRISFSDVYFSYDKTQVFSGVDIEIKANSLLALVGESGVGKTTVAKLLLRHYEPSKGCITIDGVDIRDIKLHSLRKLITFVEQRPVLFDDTLANNILIGNKNADASELLEAIKLARLDGFVNSLQSGINTQVGEMGSLLSEGEKQRIALARAFLKKSPIVILDEVTSSLDPQNEQFIRQAIENLAKHRTVIVIAHRLSTIKNADKILVMDKGKVLETGTHKDLLAKAGLYFKFASMQQVTSESKS